ncbi:hypothetical protein AAGG74_17725 [Bacillus mexicanus]|uniref:hypothetical protein n=1 Tax=Bacillus mexicanus TaxID=2834415 RepID=UPI003D2348E9
MNREENPKKNRGNYIMNALKSKSVQAAFKTTGDLAMIDAKINNTHIVYINKDGQMVKEYPDGKIEPFEGEKNE